MKDYFIRAIDEEGRIRIFVASTTNLVEEARLIHKTSPTATAAMGRALTAGVMMAGMMKDEEDLLTLKIEGNGSLGAILLVGRNNGTVKIDIMNPSADLPTRADGKLDVAGVVGNSGSITTIMDLGLKEPYVGQAEIIAGEIAEDLANYYAYSEQQPSAIGLGVLVDKDISVRAAGGYIIQLLPGVSDEDIDKIENAIGSMEPISELIDKGLSPEEVMERLLGGFSMDILDKKEVKYKCDCSREKIEKIIRDLGKTEIEAIIEEDGSAEVVCHFCNTRYQFTEENLREILVDI